MKIYGTFQTVQARVDGQYIGTAINGDVKTNILKRPLAGNTHKTHAVIILGYWLPFIVITVLLITTIGIAFCSKDEHQTDEGRTCCTKVKTCLKPFLNNVRLWKVKFTANLESSVDLQGNMAAATLICISFTIYAHFLDIYSIFVENHSVLPSYYIVGDNYFSITITNCLIVTVLFNIVGIILLIVSYCSCAAFCFKRLVTVCSKCDLYISVILCIGNTILVLSYHFQNILIAWSLTPFYAGSILLYYGVIVFVAFLSLKYTYIQTHKLISQKRIWLGCVLIITSIILIVVIVVTISFIIYIPVSGSIENSAIGITTIYHGGVLLIGGLIAYNVGGHIIGGSFSINSVLKTAVTEMKDNPFNRNDVEWDLASEEKRMSKVVNMLIKYGKVYSHLPVQSQPQADPPAPPRVYVTHIENSTCALANPSLNYPFTFQSNPIIIDGFNRPSAIAVVQNQPPAVAGPDVANQLQQGDVLVVERDGNCVSKIVVGDNGQRQRTDFFGVAGNGNGEFNHPTGIAIDHGGNIFVVDHDNHRVQKFAQNGDFIAESGMGGGNDAAANEEGEGTALINIVADNGGAEVAANDTQLQSPMGIAATQQNVYITDTGKNRIQNWNNNLVYFGVKGNGNGQFNQPFDLSFDSHGNVYVVDRGNKRIQVFNAADGYGYLRQFGSAILREPVSIAIDTQRNNAVYIVDRGKNCVSKFANNGDFIKSFTSVDLSEPCGIAVDSNGAVYVCDTGNNRVIIFSLNQVQEL